MWYGLILMATKSNAESVPFTSYCLSNLVSTPFRFKIENFYIYDRWGELLHHSKSTWVNEPSGGWDGRFNGTLVMPGVYTWVAEITFLDNETEFFAGDVTVMR